MVCNEEQPDAALDAFMKLLIPVTNKHVPIKKVTVKNCEIPFCVVERDEARGMVNKYGSPTDLQTYCKFKKSCD